jgi:uncharacterized protein YndB with AHSA1/START domain
MCGKEAHMTGPLGFSHTIVVDAPRRRVWDVLVTPEERNKYVCTENQADVRPGGAFVEVFEYGPARAGIFLVVERPHRLVQENFVFDRGVSHRYYNAFTLTDHIGGTSVRIDVEGFQKNDSEDWLREGMDFAWRIELQVLKAFVEDGEDIRPRVWKGVLIGLRFVTASTGGGDVGGVRVIDVIRGTPADQAGVRNADVISAVNGESVRDFREFREQIGAFAPRDSATFTIWRSGEKLDLPINFGSAIAGR